jgi:hypothetical protein
VPRQSEVPKNWKSCARQLAIHCIEGSIWLQDPGVDQHKGEMPNRAIKKQPVELEFNLYFYY